MELIACWSYKDIWGIDPKMVLSQNGDDQKLAIPTG
jgi:hypothetical protein